MGKEWLIILLLGLAGQPAPQATSVETPPAAAAPVEQPPAAKPAKAAVPAAPVTAAARPAACDTRPYKSLVGRTISDVLTLELPPGTRIYRVGDPITQPIPPGRLNIEINRGTRVGRIYCS